jgi:uncharacterized protein (DUF2147 family)
MPHQLHQQLTGVLSSALAGLVLLDLTLSADAVVSLSLSVACGGQEPVFRELSSLQSIDHAAAEAEALAERERKAREAMASSGGSASSSYLSGTGSDTDSDDMLHIAAWQGKEVTFMRSNQHSKERRGRWGGTSLCLLAGGWWAALPALPALVGPLS